ncbi:hypothetical protein AGOR_G00123380 [Albula goreensis]|uniref:Uncharacterized protein n=1 Tax=Albula goreensis TaxID=1534307 RepID=A0A8T3DCB4_9TELE|nr:hypothetical protein AGOR_G00123380 [Albula goreensis]
MLTVLSRPCCVCKSKLEDSEMERGCYWLLFLLWVLPVAHTDSMTTAMVHSSRRPPTESLRSTASDGAKSVESSPAVFHQLLQTGHEQLITTVTIRGHNPTPSQKQTAANGGVTRTRAAISSLLWFTTRAKVISSDSAASSTRTKRSLSTFPGNMTTPLHGHRDNEGTPENMTGNPSSPAKMPTGSTELPIPHVHHGPFEKPTPQQLPQTSLGEANQMTLNPASPKQDQVTHPKTEDTPPSTSNQNAPRSQTPEPEMEDTKATMTPTTLTLTSASQTEAPTMHITTATKSITLETTPSSHAHPSTSMHSSLKTETPSAPFSPGPTHPASTVNVMTSTSLVTTAGSSTTMETQTIKPPINPDKKTNDGDNSSQKGGAGTVVASLVGTILIIMLLTIMYIMVRKRRRQQRQMMDPNWAGPTPFLDGNGAADQPHLMPSDYDGEGGRQRDSKRISLIGFLPRRLSHRLSLVKEADEQVLMENVTAGSTFGRVQEVKPEVGNGKLPEQDQAQNENPEPNEKPIQMKDGASVNVPNVPAEDGPLAPPSTPQEDNSLDPPPAAVETMPPPSQLNENQPAPPSPPLILQEVDLGPPISEMDFPSPPPSSEGVTAPPPAPPLPSASQ